MALWGNTDTAADAPKYLSGDAATEAVDTNRDKGLKTTGWNAYSTYTTNGGTVTRHKVETLVAMTRTAADAGDLGITGDTSVEDAIVADS
jgi:hypothetical protein